MPAVAVTSASLVTGDHLSREEFVRRWEEAPEIKRAELVGGIVYMPSPLSASHGEKDSLAGWWLQNYAVATPGCTTGHAATWFMLRDAPQPDSYLRVSDACGGQSFIRDGFYHGAPELAVEISLSSTSYDLHQKRLLYARAGVKEYLAFVLSDRQVRWGRLVGEEYEALEAWPDGTFRSIIFPGLWLDADAFWRDGLPRLQAALERGLATPDHAEFAARLAQKQK